jgi:hypothetical protein
MAAVVLMLDIDQFKSIDGRFRHASMARMVSRSFGRPELVACAAAGCPVMLR